MAIMPKESQNFLYFKVCISIKGNTKINMMIKKILFFGLFLLPSFSLAQIKLNIDLILKRGVDKGLVLINELHSVESIRENKEIQLKMKNGLTVYLRATFYNSKEDYGPSGMFRRRLPVWTICKL